MNNLQIDKALVAERIKSLREMCEISVESLAKVHGISVEEYLKAESGEMDFGFTFLHKTAGVLGIDLSELLTGEQPKLTAYTVERYGEGLKIERRAHFDYLHIASRFKNRLAEPFIVTAVYNKDDENKEIETSTHEGQEMDFVLEGTLKVRVGSNFETLHAGDNIIYNSAIPHGMVAVGGKDCKFLAIVMKTR